MKMIKSGKMQSTQVARERKKVAGTLPTNRGYRPFPNCCQYEHNIYEESVNKGHVKFILQ